MKRMIDDNKLRVDGDEIIVDGAFKATTIEQTEPNLKIEATPTYPTGIELSANVVPYVALEVINGVFWIVCMTSVKNTNESPYSGALTFFDGITIPAEIGSKIFRLDGTKLSEAPGTKNIIAYGPANQDSNAKTAAVTSYAANKISVYIGAVNIGAGFDAVFSFRIPIILL